MLVKGQCVLIKHTMFRICGNESQLGQQLVEKLAMPLSATGFGIPCQLNSEFPSPGFGILETKISTSAIQIVLHRPNLNFLLLLCVCLFIYLFIYSPVYSFTNLFLFSGISECNRSAWQTSYSLSSSSRLYLLNRIPDYIPWCGCKRVYWEVPDDSLTPGS